MNARIGNYGRAVHQLDRYETPATHGRLVQWGASLCGPWAGEARVTDEPVTCRACLLELRSRDNRQALSPEARSSRRPPPPGELVGALQDRVNVSTGKVRPARVARIRRRRRRGGRRGDERMLWLRDHCRL